MPERCCLYCRPTDNLENAEIARAVSQSELIEPLDTSLLVPQSFSNTEYDFWLFTIGNAQV